MERSALKLRFLRVPLKEAGYAALVDRVAAPNPTPKATGAIPVYRILDCRVHLMHTNSFNWRLLHVRSSIMAFTHIA